MKKESLFKILIMIAGLFVFSCSIAGKGKKKPIDSSSDVAMPDLSNVVKLRKRKTSKVGKSVPLNELAVIRSTGTKSSETVKKPEAPLTDTMKAITLFEDFLVNNKNFEDQEVIADIYLKIAELHFKDEENRFLEEMGKYDEIIETAGFKDLSELVPPPTYDFSNAIEKYQHIIKTFPEYKKVDAAIYGLAYSFYEQNRKDQAHTIFQKLIKRYPKSSYINESNMRMGEYLFTINDFDGAAEIFRRMLKVKNNPYYEIVLYKLGWTYYSQGNFPDAITTFLSIHLDGANLKSSVSRGLFNDSLRYVARIFSGTSGLSGMINYVKENKREKHLPHLLRFLGDTYKEDESYKAAGATYNKFLELFPNDDNVPLIEHSIIEIKDIGIKKQEQIISLLEAFVVKYDEKSVWFKNVKDKVIKGQVLTITKIALAKTSLYRRSVHTLFEIINDTAGLEDKSGIQKFLNSGQKDRLKRVCYRNIALIFFNSNGIEGLLNYAVGNKSYQIHLPDILRAIANIYKEQNRLWQAVQAYQVLLENYPGLEDAPIIQNTIVQIYEQGGKPKEAMEERKIFIEKFKPGGEWYSAEKINSDRRWGTLALAEKSLRRVALYYHALAQKDKKLKYIDDAVAYYLRYMEFFPDHSRIYEMTFYLAELLNELRDPLEAVPYYEKVAWSKSPEELKKEEESEDISKKKIKKIRKDAAYAIVLLFDNLRKSENYMGQYSKGLVAVIDKFVDHFPKNEKNPELLFKAGSILFQYEKYEETRKFFLKLIKKYPQNNLSAEAIGLVAQGYFEIGEYSEAENWYISALSSSYSGEFDVAKDSSLKKMLASTKFKKAEKLQADGKFAESGKEFFEISKVSQDKLVASIALFNAGVNYKKINDCVNLFSVNSDLLTKYSDSEYSKGVMLSYLECEKFRGKLKRGAGNIKKFVSQNPGLSLLSDPLLMAADIYKELKDTKNALDTYILFTNLFVNDFKTVEAFSKAGEIELNKKNLINAKKYFNRAYSNFKIFINSGGSVEKYYAVKAKFYIGEILFDEFKKIKIRAPLEVTMKKKQIAMENVLTEYTESAAFDMVEWTTASTYKIGMTFEEFKTSLMESEKPKGLSEIELEDYEFLIEEQAYPFEEKAIEAYQVNVQRLYSGTIYNEWIVKTLERMAYLFPWSYNKKEEMVREDSMFLIMED